MSDTRCPTIPWSMAASTTSGTDTLATVQHSAETKPFANSLRWRRRESTSSFQPAAPLPAVSGSVAPAARRARRTSREVGIAGDFSDPAV
jgi:hypothetical protein